MFVASETATDRFFLGPNEGGQHLVDEVLLLQWPWQSMTIDDSEPEKNDSGESDSG